MNFVYSLSYNPNDVTLSTAQLSVFVRDSRKVDQFYQPFAGTFFLKSPETLQSLYESFSQLFAGRLFTLTWIQPSQVTGALPAPVWTWLESGADAFRPMLPQ